MMPNGIFCSEKCDLGSTGNQLFSGAIVDAVAEIDLHYSNFFSKTRKIGASEWWLPEYVEYVEDGIIVHVPSKEGRAE